MKKRVLVALLALAALIAFAPAARALVLPDSYYEANVSDRSSLFRETSPGSGDWEAYVPGMTIEIGDEQRTVATIDALDYNGFLVPADPVGTFRIAASSSLPGYTAKALTGMFYDLQVTGFKDVDADGVGDPPAFGAPSDIYFGLGVRYTNAGGMDGTWTDLYPGAQSGIVATTLGGYGGILVMYDDDPIANPPTMVGDAAYGGDGDGLTGAFVSVDPGDGQEDWREPGDASGTSPHPSTYGVPTAVADGSLSVTDYFPTISDVAGTIGPGDSGSAVPVLVAVFTPLPMAVLAGWGVPGGSVMVEKDFDPDVGGFGLAFANIIGGSWAHKYDSDIFGPGLDIRLDFRMDVAIDPFTGLPILTEDGWQIDSTDPIQWGAIPEPTSLSLLGLGIAGLAAYRRKRKK